MAFLCKVSRINGTKGQRERIVCELLQRKKPATTECAFKSSCVKPKRDTTFPRVYFEWTAGSRILIFSHATNLPLLFFRYPCCANVFNRRLANRFTKKNDTTRYDTIEQLLIKYLHIYQRSRLIKNMMQRNELFPLPLFYFSPKIFPTILRSTDLKQTLKREKGKKKKRINFKTSYHHTTALVNIKYSKGLNNTCNQ